jgi:hypothetical protein
VSRERSVGTHRGTRPRGVRDFCRQVRDLLARHGRAADYVEVSLDSPYRYNPLHNDLDAYALAYGIATLMTNLFGRGKEPFWQQASTNLVKFVILLHQTLGGYVTLLQVYEHVINPDKLHARIADGEHHFRAEHRRAVLDKREHLFTDVLKGWAWHDDETGTLTWTEWSADLLDALGVMALVSKTTASSQWLILFSGRLSPSWTCKPVAAHLPCSRSMAKSVIHLYPLIRSAMRSFPFWLTGEEPCVITGDK